MLCIWVKWKYLGNFLDYSIKITIYLVRPLKLFNIFEKLETFQQGNIFLKLHRSKETGILNYLTSNWLISINCPIFYPNSKLYLLFSVVKFSSLILQRGKTPTYRKENYENFTILVLMTNYAQTSYRVESLYHITYVLHW